MYTKWVVFKIVVFVALCLAFYMADVWIYNTWVPEQHREAAINQLEGGQRGTDAFRETNEWQTMKNFIEPIGVLALGVLLVLFFYSDFVKLIHAMMPHKPKSERDRGATGNFGGTSRPGNVVVAVLLLIVVVGVVLLLIYGFYCWFWRLPYNAPKIEAIEPWETAYLIDMESGIDSQSFFGSTESIQQKVVKTQRVWIQQRWVKEGRWRTNGRYIPLQKLIKVDRTPVTRWLTAEIDTGTSPTDEALRVNSREGIPVSINYVFTGVIYPEDSALFLYSYKTKSLPQIMDTEVRSEAQKAADVEARKYTLNELRARKPEIYMAVEQHVAPLFRSKGITITVASMFGGFVYSNKDLQTGIDKVFIAQQGQVINTARNEAQSWINKTTDTVAQEKAYKERTVAAGKAEALRKIATAQKASQKVDLFIQLEQLKIRQKAIEAWKSGTLPSRMIDLGGMQGPGLIIPIMDSLFRMPESSAPTTSLPAPASSLSPLAVQK